MKLFIYDHCPYCVKARMIFGLKNRPFTLVTLLNDDEDTSTRMIGRKMVPILEKDDGSFMPESMDIVQFIDRLDGRPMVGPARQGSPLAGWLAESRDYLSKLTQPRWVEAPLEEFATEGAREYFRRKKEASIGPFAGWLAESDSLKSRAEEHLKSLAPLIASPEAAHGELTEDDFHLFAALRSLSIVKGIAYPPAVEAYRQRMSERSGVPLHTAIAR